MEILRRIRAGLALDDSLNSDAEMRAFAERSYAMCVRWFGRHADQDWPVELVFGRENGCWRNSLLRCYTIVVGRHNETTEQRVATIAHEVYHRTTMLKKTARVQLWIDEMMAFLASQHALIETGYREYSTQRAEWYRSEPRLGSMEELWDAAPLRRGFQFIYPAGLPETAAVIGMSLETRIDWSQVRLLVNAPDWANWLQRLPRECAEHAAAVLSSKPADL